MGKLSFKIQAEYEKVDRLRKSIYELKQEMQGFAPASKEFKTINGTINKQQKEIVKLAQEIAKLETIQARTAAAKTKQAATELVAMERIEQAAAKKAMQEAANLAKIDAIRRKSASVALMDEERQKRLAIATEVARNRANAAINRGTNGIRMQNVELQKQQSFMSGFGGGMIGGAAMYAGQDLIRQIIDVRGQFQKFEAVLGNTFNDTDKAKEAMKMISDFAASTPFQVDQLTGSFIKLANMGFTPTLEDMTKMGDLASSTGKDFDQLAEAILDAQTGENERLKEFGIRASKNGDKVTYTFKEQATTVENTASAIRAYILSLGDLQGVQGANAKISATLSGEMSNLGDKFTAMHNEIGTSTEGVISDAIGSVASLVENYETVGKTLLGLVATYGTYRTAVMVTATIENIRYQSTLVQMAGMTKMGALTDMLRIKTAALSKTMLANPYVLVATLVVGLGAAAWALHDGLTAAERAQKKLNEENKKLLDTQNERKQKAEELISTIRSEVETEYSKIKAYNELKSISPALTSAYSRETLATLDMTNAKKLLNKESEKEYKLKKEQRLLDAIERNKTYTETVGGSITGGPGTVVTMTRTSQEIEELREIKNLRRDIANDEKIHQEAIWSAQPKEVKVASLKANIKSLQQEYDELKLIVNKDLITNGGFSPNSWLLELKGKAIKEKETTLESIDTPDKKDGSYADKLKKAKEDWQKAKAELAKIEKDKADFSPEQYYKAKSQHKEAETTYKGLGGVTDSKQVDKSLENKKKLAKEEKELELKNQQDTISLMQEGSKKKRAQIEFDYKKEIALISDNEAELIKLNGDKPLTGLLQVGVSQSKENATNRKDSRISHLNKKTLEEEKQAMNEHLASYGEYMQKRQAITDLYNERISKATTQGEKLSLGEEMKKELASVDDEAQKKTSIITKLFSDMSKRTVDDMRTIADEAQKMLDYVNGGEFETDSEGKGLFGITQEQFDLLVKSPDKLKSIKDEIANVSTEANNSETALNKISGGLKKMFSSTSDSKQFNEALAEVSEGMNDVMQAGQFLSNSLGSLSDAFGGDALEGVTSGLNVAMDAMGATMDGAKAGAAFGPWGAAAGAAIGLVSSLAGSVAKIHDEKNEKRIQVMQEQIEVLDETYEKLGDSIAKAYSTDASKLIEQQEKLLEQQKVLIQNQIMEEQDKKKTDDGRIEEWQQQIEDINKTIEENKEKAIDAIFGQDLKSAIDEFAQAYVDAWAAGEDRAKSMKDVAKNMIKGVIVEMIKSSEGLGDTVAKIREMILGYMSDGVMEGWEQEQLDKYVEDEVNRVNDKFSWADDYLSGDSDSQQNATGKGIQAMTQDTGNELNGRFTALQMAGEDIRFQSIKQSDALLAMLAKTISIETLSLSALESMNGLKMIAEQSYYELEQIKTNTKDTVKALKVMGEKMDSMNKKLEKL